MTSLSSLAGAGAVPVASSIGLTQLDIDNQDEATTSTRDRREVQDTFSSNTEEILATGSVSIAPTLSQIEPSMEDPTPPYARESSIAEVSRYTCNPLQGTHLS